MADPGFDGKEHFLGSLSNAGYIHTPNAAPETFAPSAPEFSGPKTDTGMPMGQSQVGFKGVAMHDGEMNTRQMSCNTDNCIAKGSDMGGAKMPPYTEYA